MAPLSMPVSFATGHPAADARLVCLIGGITEAFVSASPKQMDEVLVSIQRLIVRMLELERSSLWQMDPDRSGLCMTHYWQVPGWPPLPLSLNAATELPWSHAQVMKGATIVFSRLGDLPPEAARDAEMFRRHGPKASIVVPLRANDELLGAVTFAMLSTERAWSREEISGLELIARIIGSFISRHRAELHAEAMRREIARASRASVLGEVAAVLAHELNQPLAAILGNAQAARRFLAAGNPDLAEMRAILEDIIRDDKRASEVVGNLRAMMDGSPMPRELHQPDELIDEVCGFLSEGLARDHIQLLRIPATPGHTIRFARVEILQVLVNLILNAAQSMAATAHARRQILVRSFAQGDWFVVEITDHGCGLPGDEQLDRLFEPFHTSKPNGLGMGLTICRRIIHAHGGTIHGRNHEAGGATFTFTLPLPAVAVDGRQQPPSHTTKV